MQPDLAFLAGKSENNTVILLFPGFKQLQLTANTNYPEDGLTPKTFSFLLFKDGAYYCYCAYVLRISRYSDFLSLMLTNTGIFLRGLKLSGESRS